MESIKKSEIVLFWDLNPDKTINPELIEKKLKLKYSHSNKNIITREEIRNGKKSESILDYFFSTQKIEKLERLEKLESDHFPILIKIQLQESTIKTKLIPTTNQALTQSRFKEYLKYYLANHSISKTKSTKINEKILY